MTTQIKKIREQYPDTMVMDGYDDCIIGICRRIGQEDIIAYDFNMIINKLITEDDMTYEDAIEFFEFNQIGAWVGETTPCFVEVL